MSRERRPIRPFTVDPSLGSALDETTLWLDDLCCAAGSSLAVDDGSFARHEVRLIWASEEGFDRLRQRLIDGAWATGVHPQWLHLVVVARTGSLKVAEKLLDCGLDDLESLERSVRIDTRPTGCRRPVFCTGGHGAVVDAYIALAPNWLARSVAERRLPKRAATWLARVTFRLDSGADAAMFHPRPLNDAKRNELGLPRGTLRYVDLRGEDMLEPVDGTPDIEVWVDEEVLAALSADSSSPAAMLFQRQLALDFVGAAVFEYARASDGTPGASVGDGDVQDSLIGKVVGLVAGRNADNEHRARIFRQCRDEPARVIAQAEHALGLREGARKTLGVSR
ncbi:hypothetical protein [Candidatus Poriferisodalis sp.]|uniref:hypothetical protein n=1 Tax=Candidatus Poriferisodalis sp. TaxID=3101277 RepID=UPI003B526719